MLSTHSRSRTLAIVLACLAPLAVSAQPADDAEDDSVRCVSAIDQRSERFAGLQKEAQDLNRRVCLALFSVDYTAFDEVQKGLYNDFGLTAIETASAQLSNSDITDWRTPFDAWLERISTSDFKNKDVREMTVGPTLTAPNAVFFGDPAKMAVVNDPSDSTCGPQRNSSCMDVLKDLAVAINVYNDSYTDFALQSTRTKLGNLSADWDDFLDNGRSQTLLDLVATTVLEKRHFRKDYLVGPPRRQWALLHPGLVIEHANAAEAGDRDKMAIAIEWFGVNWWSDSSPLFGVPFGISLASIYSDRVGVDAVGHGVMLHFDNRYSLGWASRGGDNSVYLTLDLLKFVEDKKKQFRRYKEEMFEFD